MKSNLLAVILCVFFAAGCMASLDKKPREKCGVMPSEKVMDALKTNCVSCHNKDFNTKEDVCGLRIAIITAVKTGYMPKLGKLPENYKDILVNWK